MMLRRALSTLVVLVAGVAAAEDSCPAGSSAETCAAKARETAKAVKDKAVSAAKDVVNAAKGNKGEAPAKADLITQELEELTALKKICKDRITLLEDLRSTLHSGVNVSLPESHMKMLQTKLPLMSEIITTAESTPTGSADDYVFSKASIPQDEAVSFVKFLPVRSRSSSASSSAPSASPSPFSALLVAVQADGNVRLFTPSGEMVLSFSAGHNHPVTNLAVSQSLEGDSTILTADAGGVVRLHKVTSRPLRQARRNTTDPKVEKISQYLEPQLNITAQFTMQMQAPPGTDGEPSKITALALGSQQQGGKYLVTGDAEGKVSIFSKNGTFKARVDAAVTAGSKVERLYPHSNSLMFHVGSEWGFINVDRLDVHHVECPDFTGRITSMVVDSQKATRVLVADEEGVVWVFNIKDRKNCKVEHHFPKGTTMAPLDLASVEGYTLGLERAGRGAHAASVLAINMSHIGKGRQAKDAPTAVSWRRGLVAVRDWAVLKRHNQGDLIALLSEDGREVEILELLMASQKEIKEDTFGNMKMPVIAVAVVLVLGYQYMKNKGKFGGGGGGGGGGGAGSGKQFDPEALQKLRSEMAQKKKEKAGIERDNPTAGPPRSAGPKS